MKKSSSPIALPIANKTVGVPAVIDVDDRFRTELNEVRLRHPSISEIQLRGDPFLVAIAQHLLLLHAPKIRVHVIATIPATISSTMTTTQALFFDALSQERFGVRFVQSFLQGTPPPSLDTLLYSIPESSLVMYAKKNNLAGSIREEKDEGALAVRSMLDTIVQSQPQTYFSLSSGARRLLLAQTKEKRENTKKR